MQADRLREENVKVLGFVTRIELTCSPSDEFSQVRSS
jgi:hypothetical protein